MLGKHTAIYFAGRVIPGLVSLATLAVFTRIMTPAEYGNYALLLAAVGVVNAVCFQWLGLSVGRYYPIHKDDDATLMSVSGVGFAVILALTAVVAGVWALFDQSISLALFISVMAVGWSQAWFDLNLRLATAKLNPTAYGVASSLKAIAALVLGMLLFFAGLRLVGILLGLALALLVSSVMFWRYWTGFRVRAFDPALLKQFVVYGTPLALTFLLILVTDFSDRLFLAWYHGTAAVGSYAPAYDLTQQTVGTLMTIVNVASFPLVVSALENEGLAPAQRQLRENGRLLVAIAVPAAVALVVLADDLARLMVGAEFRSAAEQIIPLISIATFVSGLRSGFFDYAFQLGRKTHYQAWVVGAAAISNVLLNLLLIPRFSVVGAAYSTLGALLIALAMSVYLGRKAFPLPRLHGETLLVAVAALVMALVLIAFEAWEGMLALVVKSSIGFVCYAALCFYWNICEIKSSLSRYVSGRFA